MKNQKTTGKTSQSPEGSNLLESFCVMMFIISPLRLSRPKALTYWNKSVWESYNIYDVCLSRPKALTYWNSNQIKAL